MQRVEGASQHLRSLIVAARLDRRSTVALDLVTAEAVLVALDFRAQCLAQLREALGELAETWVCGSGHIVRISSAETCPVCDIREATASEEAR